MLNNKNNYKLYDNLIYLSKNIIVWDKKIYIYYLCFILINALYPFCYIIFPKVLVNDLVYENSIQNIIRTLIVFMISLLLLSCIKEYLDAIYDPKVTFIRFQFLSIYYKKCMTMKYELTEEPKILDNIEKTFSAASLKDKGFAGLIRRSLNIAYESIILVIFFVMLLKLNYLIIFFLLINVLSVFYTQYYAKNYEYEKEGERSRFIRKIRYFYNVMYENKYGKDVRLFNLTKLIETKFITISECYIKFYKKIRIKFLLSKIIDSIFLFLREYIVYLYLIYQVINNNLDIGSFTMYLALVFQFTISASDLFTNMAFIKSENNIINDYRNFIDLEDDTTETNYNQEFEDSKSYNSKGYIELINVSFKYPNTDRYILKNLNLTIKKNEKLAIVGINGAGKTTIIKLLCRLYNPTEGQILCNGINIKYYDINQYYQKLSVIFQDINLLSFTIAENVTLNEINNINLEKLNNALDKVGILDKINKLENGFNTCINKNIDNNGVIFSGGENQKLALARALYKDSEFLILDEPTAAFDPIAEYDLYMMFNSVINDKTAIFISHRLASTRFCDRIILIEEGKIVEEGTHDYLLNVNKKYANMFKIQSQYYN